jgi:hypothetical protein
LLGRDGDREERERPLDDPLEREADARPFALRFAAAVERLRAEAPLPRAALCDLPLVLAPVFALFVLLEAVRARAEDFWFLDGRAFV